LYRHEYYHQVEHTFINKEQVYKSFSREYYFNRVS